MHKSRNAIALLITLMFVIVITVAIGYGLKQVNVATKIVQEENFLYQRNIIIEDILNILNNSRELQAAVENNSSIEFFTLLSQAGFIPFEYGGVEIILKIKSARGKFNPSAIDETRGTLLRQYLGNHNINSQYVDLLIDNTSGIKEDNSYNTPIFDENPNLFRDYIASAKHLKIINDFYAREYNDNSLQNIDFNELFYYGADDANTSIDVNYATAEVWELMLGCQRERAEFLSLAGGSYNSIEDLNLNSEEEVFATNFNISFLEPIVLIELEITINGQGSTMSFEYNIQNKKGSNFAYEI